MNRDNINKVLKIYGIKVISDIIAKLRSVGAYSSGRLSKSIKVDVIEAIDDIQLEIKALDYFDYIEKGRKPGTYPNITALKQWAKIKGIPSNKVYPIARSIYKYGIKPRPILKDVIKSNTFTQLRNDVSIAYRQDIENEINNVIININR